MMWCWRCQMEIPMLGEEGFTISREARKKLPGRRWGRKWPLFGPWIKPPPVSKFQSAVCQAYTELTGFEETDANARISLYGPPCEACGWRRP